MVGQLFIYIHINLKTDFNGRTQKQTGNIPC